MPPYGKRVFTWVTESKVSKMRSSWMMGWALNAILVRKSQREIWHNWKGNVTEVTQPQATECWQLQEIGEAKHRSLPKFSKGSVAQWYQFWISGLHNCKRINVLFHANYFVVICYGSHRKPIQLEGGYDPAKGAIFCKLRGGSDLNLERLIWFPLAGKELEGHSRKRIQHKQSLKVRKCSVYLG